MIPRLAVTVKEAADALSVSVDTIRRMFDAGELDGFRSGRVIRISLTSLRAYIGLGEEPPQRGSANEMPDAIAEYLGHSTPRLLIERYAHS